MNPCIFCRIASHDETPVWILRESHEHMAFLTPFPNTPGVTVVATKLHHPSDLLEIPESTYVSLMRFSRSVAQDLKRVLGVARVAMVVEGTGVDHAHIKLFPLHGELGAATDVWHPKRSFSEEYDGWLHTLEGPRMSDKRLDGILDRFKSEQSFNLHVGGASGVSRLIRPESWRDPDSHLERALNDPWFTHLATLQDAIHACSTRFFGAQGLRYLMLPVTTSSVSSPMAAGSDSLPVSIRMFERDIHLADSMQFMLEYGLRICGGGVWYQMVSFRGEATDALHLPQFHHIEAEIDGGLDDVLTLVETYMRALTREILSSEGDAVRALAGTDEHVRQLARLDTYPRVRHDDAVRRLAGQPGAITERAGCPVVTTEGERLLLEEHGSALWLTHQPAPVVPFYQKTVGNGAHALCADLLLPGVGEVVGAGERHEGAPETLGALAAQGVSADEYGWYVDMKRRQPRQTSGFGMGVERFLLWLTRCPDIRDLQLALRHQEFDGVP